ncbi:PREDICTED: GATA zinc finger domain-containing protein 15-like isoform X2 [Wasmannia auropunctata]|uniref:GATA zinc finger domain-containing protein 15-like isoform X2 n=2 Tax=Wasmannia auropunctata TaxID=64793 RepID=UPI0005EE34BB|nr:PREDICTED: GATA zinc finger domain-containing protein 15-like isoform X2 [Wasmannia auropunctata]
MIYLSHKGVMPHSEDYELSLPSCSYMSTVSEIGEGISRICKRQNEGLYEYSEDKCKTAVQNCSVCSTNTTKQCEVCLTYYCSRTCQVNDWPQHQAECSSIPALDVIDNTLLIKQDVNKRPSTPNVDTGECSGEVKRRRIDTFNVWEEEANNTTRNGINKESNIKITQNNYHDAHDNYAPEIKKENQAVIKKEKSNHNSNYKPKTSVKERHNNNSNVRDKICNNDRNYPQRNSFQNNKGSTSYDRENTNSQTSSSVNDSSYKETYLSNKEFTTVQIVKSLGNNKYLVFNSKDADARTILMTKLQDIKNSANLPPTVGGVYGVKYEGLWYRAMVTSLNPTTIQYIDFDEQETLKKDAELKDLGDLIESPTIIRKICVPIWPMGISDKYRNLQVGDEISVRMIFVDSEKYSMVELKEEQFAEKKKFAAD